MCDLTGDVGDVEPTVITLGERRRWELDLSPNALKLVEAAIDAALTPEAARWVSAAARPVHADTDEHDDSDAGGGPLGLSAEERDICRAWGLSQTPAALKRIGRLKPLAERGKLPVKLVEAWEAAGRPVVR